MPSPIPGWPPHDWSPLASDNPVPGDTAAIRECAGYYDGVATAIAQHNVALRVALCGSPVEWRGHAADAYHKSLGDLPPVLAKVHDRMAAINSALSSWADKLEGAQRDALAALHKAQQAYQDEQDKDRQMQSMKPLDPDATPAQQAAFQDDRAALRRGMDNDRQALADAWNLLKRAEDNRDNDARTCVNALNAAAGDSLKDPDWDLRQFGLVVDQIATFVSGLANFVGVWAGFAAIALCWVPGVGEALAAIAAIAGAVTLAADLVRLATRDPQVGGENIVFDALCVIPFAGLFSKLTGEKALLPGLQKVLDNKAAEKEMQQLVKAFAKGDVRGFVDALTATGTGWNIMWSTLTNGLNAVVSGLGPPGLPDLNALPDGP
ncbi:MAG: WXG100 family type VII secretion target [Mycobacteriales bacterium]